jgi:hypothetical protein
MTEQPRSRRRRRRRRRCSMHACMFPINDLFRSKRSVVVMSRGVHWRAERLTCCRCIKPDECSGPAYIMLEIIYSPSHSC